MNECTYNGAAGTWSQYSPETHQEALVMDEGFDMGQEAASKDKNGLYLDEPFRNIGEKQTAEAIAEGTPISVIIADVDALKTVNDTRGHLLGDEVIDAAGKITMKALNDSGTPGNAGRIGGDEFGLLLWAAKEEAEKICGNLQEAFQYYVNEPGNEFLKQSGVDLSIGVAALSPDVSDLADLLSKADEEMLKNKLDKKKLTDEQLRVLMKVIYDLEKAGIRRRDIGRIVHSVTKEEDANNTIE